MDSTAIHIKIHTKHVNINPSRLCAKVRVDTLLLQHTMINYHSLLHMSITFLYDDKKYIRENGGYDEYYILDDFERESSLSIHTYCINDDYEEPLWLKDKYVSKNDGFFADCFNLDYLISEGYIS